MLVRRGVAWRGVAWCGLTKSSSLTPEHKATEDNQHLQAQFGLLGQAEGTVYVESLFDLGKNSTAKRLINRSLLPCSKVFPRLG